MLARSARTLVAAQARASNAGAAFYATGNDPSMSDKMSNTVSKYLVDQRLLLHIILSKEGSP